MADINRTQGQGVPSTMVTKYKDMADGTHALVVSAREGTSTITALPQWEYLGGETLTSGGVATACTIPATASIFELRAEGGAVYFQINGGAPASTLSPGYVASGAGEVIGPLSNLNSLQIYAVGVNTVAHILYFREVSR